MTQNTTALKIEGMSCSHCKAAVQKALEGVDGVVRVEVDLGTGLATVAGTADRERLIAAVVGEGYRAAPQAL
ncbi:MAG TPA: heavy-metal-associated domain-containing protein [Trueperaceae bacterium]|nr:heavy-metal-associated domain-containing protein [Trueperaceae bacterium]